MRNRKSFGRVAALLSLAALVSLVAGCSSGGDDAGDGGSTKAGEDMPVFSLAWSEYPSWSVFGVADVKGLIDGDEGKVGPVEKEWGVDIVLKQVDYDTCITLYGSGEVDAVCITNMDILAPSLGRDSVAILPTSTSVGADACITVGIDTLDELKGVPTHGLEKSVSQYCFERCLEKRGEDPAEYPFRNMDPGAAAAALQTGSGDVRSIIVWNPFVLQTLRTNDKAKRLFDSSEIPEEIIDMVVVNKESLGEKGGADFAGAVIDTFYRVNRLMEDPKAGDKTLVALGEKFSDLELKDMKQVVKETRFYAQPQDAIALFEGETFQQETMPLVVDFCVSHDIVEKKPQVGFGDAKAQLNFDSQYLKKVKGDGGRK